MKERADTKFRLALFSGRRSKGLAQLSSATDSTSEVLAATPKAVKSANANGRVPLTRKVNGHALSTDISLGTADVGALPVGGRASDGEY